MVLILNSVDGELRCSTVVAGDYAVNIHRQQSFGLASIQTLGAFLVDHTQANM